MLNRLLKGFISGLNCLFIGFTISLWLLFVPLFYYLDTYPLNVSASVGAKYEAAKVLRLSNLKSQHIKSLETQLRDYKLIDKVLRCESSYRHENLWGDLNYTFPAYGIAQFQERTFKELAGKAGYKNLEWKDKEDQVRILAWGLRNGYGKRWSCY